MSAKYQAYEEYKDSGVEWIGQYPLRWTLTRVKFESYVKARVGWHGLKSDDFTDEGAYLVTGSDFKGPVIKWEDCYHCDFDRYEQDPYIQLKEGDLLITKDGTIGKVALVNDLNGKATLNSGVFVVRPLADSYTSKFYFWLLQASIFTGFVDFNKTGSTIVHLYQDTFVNFRYAIPSLNEQQKIANFLDHETAKIDTLIEKQQQLIKLLKEKRQAVISHAVTKGLNPSTPMRDSGVEWLGEVPEHWIVTRAKFVSEIFIPQRNKPELNDSVGVAWAIMEDMKNVYIKETRKYIDEKSAKLAGSKTLKAGAVIASCVGNFGIASINKIDVIINQQLQAFVPNTIKAEYLRETVSISKSYFELVGTAATLVYVNQEGFENLPVLIPPVVEQEDICVYIKKECCKFNKLVDQCERALHLYRERRTALISAAVTGKIDVRNWVAPERPCSRDISASLHSTSTNKEKIEASV
ncbi:MAG: restriction endonuclease subunit S [Methylococcaceae bacterium]|nr:restriction endonuclease subunit S [Methylococcaceae bacterium]